MLKGWQWCMLYSLLLVLVLGGQSFASGLITFQLEVVPGFSISAPEQLVLPPVAPGQASQTELSMRVWSNVRWNLDIRVLNEGTEGGLYGVLEMKGEDSVWHELGLGTRMLRSQQSSTGENGRELSIPIRFMGSFDDVPGNYSVQVEFTVVPSL